MMIPKFTSNVLDQSCALVQAIHSVDTMETSDPFERQVAKLLQAALERQLHDIADSVSSWRIEEILSSSRPHPDDHLTPC
jgi:hypothetical protein